MQNSITGLALHFMVKYWQRRALIPFNKIPKHVGFGLVGFVLFQYPQKDFSLVTWSSPNLLPWSLMLSSANVGIASCRSWHGDVGGLALVTSYHHCHQWDSVEHLIEKYEIFYWQLKNQQCIEFINCILESNTRHEIEGIFKVKQRLTKLA